MFRVMVWDSFLRFLVDMAWFAGGWVALALAFRLIRLAWRRVARSRLGWRVRERRAARIRRVGWRADRATGRISPVPSPFPAPTPAPPAPPEWSAALIVRPSEDAVAPSVQLRGPPLGGPARIVLEVIDEEPRRHLVGERDVADPDLGTELRLPAFPVPEDRTAEDVLSWVWRLVLEVGGEERVLVVERLRPMTGLTREAELGAWDDAAV